MKHVEGGNEFWQFVGLCLFLMVLFTAGALF